MPELRPANTFHSQLPLYLFTSTSYSSLIFAFTLLNNTGKIFCFSDFCCTFASDGESQKRLVAHHRVVFDANYSRTRRLVRSLIRNPQIPQSSASPLYKEILQILTKITKIFVLCKKILLFEAFYSVFLRYFNLFI